MKLQKTDPNQKNIEILKERLGDENLTSISLSFATMADILSRYLCESGSLNLPVQVKYAIMQTYHYLSVIATAFHNPEKLEKRINRLHFESYDPTNDLEVEKRFIFLVKELYSQLKEQGKV